VAGFTRYGMNAPRRILEIISNEFNAQIVSEHQPEYWGFESHAEWDAAWEQMSREAEKEFYEQVERFIRGEPHNIVPGTVGMKKAEVARDLVAQRPELLAAENRKQLIETVNEAYDRDHAVTVILTDEQVAFARMGPVAETEHLKSNPDILHNTLNR
jgi:hypothetical protein